jgi:hypothetical protein
MRRTFSLLLTAALSLVALSFFPSAPATAGAIPSLCGALATSAQGTVPNDLDEISGLVVSRAEADTAWVEEDSGNAAALTALDISDGTVRGTYTITGATNVDWEDLAITSAAGKHGVLYIADIGDNAKRRANVKVFRVNEPNVPDGAGHTGSVAAQRVTLRYPDGKYDAETLLVDPKNRELYVVTKDGSSARVYKTQGAPATGSTTTLKFVTTLPLGGELATGGAVSTSGRFIVVRSYGAIFVWERRATDTMGAALKRAPCRPTVQLGEIQGEAVGVTADGTNLVTIAERLHPSLPAPRFRVRTP